ncbi:MAG TPA: hypothetical protein VGK36_18670 [Candidatus Angelobacter sp.]|jgi:aspartate/methionine/tyrosine aminotransferase
MDRKPVLLATSIIYLVLLISCVSVRPGYIEDDKRDALRAIENFHARLSSGQYAAIYDASDPALQQTGSREELIAAMQATRARFGEFRQVTDSEMNVIVHAPVEIRAAYNSKFEKGDATELFVFLRRGNQIKLAMYQISPGTTKLTGVH